MPASRNVAQLIGHLGADPDIRTMQNGNRVARLSVATTSAWTNSNTNQRQEKTHWHTVIVFNQNIVRVCEDYIRKGAKIFIEGQIENRSWEQNGETKYTTEIVLRPYRGELIMLDTRDHKNTATSTANQDGVSEPGLHSMASAPLQDDEDEIPF